MQVLKRILALGALAAAPAWAVPPATVDAVQMPAWIEHQGRTLPLAAGMPVAHGDRIRTGSDARVYLKLAEGSTVKLGENAGLALFSRSLKPQSEFKGALDVLSGAFRFTTDALKRVKAREVAIRVGTATAGIRGTDLWGHASAQEDLICLIEGRIEVAHAGLDAPLAMSEPKTFFVAPRGAAPKPVAPVDPRELERWAQQTEIAAGAGAARLRGKWKLLLGSHADEREALAQYDAARLAGFAARIMPRQAAAAMWAYDVEVRGFGDAADAQAAAGRLRSATGIAATARR